MKIDYGWLPGNFVPSVSWIDPNFNDFGFTGNDDHPPADIADGQELALKLIHAVTSSPQWNKSVLVVVYDEHGGLFDHVSPPAAQDDSTAFRQYGVRVPAFVVSPWVDPGSVSSMIFDHTSLIKTILLRFCCDAAGNIPDMGSRVGHANHLGSVLTRMSIATPIPFDGVISRMAEVKMKQFHATFTTSRATPLKKIKPSPGDLQIGLARARGKLTEMGLPEGRL
jgi:phospholipase C